MPMNLPDMVLPLSSESFSSRFALGMDFCFLGGLLVRAGSVERNGSTSGTSTGA